MFSRWIYYVPLAALAERVAGLVGLIVLALIAYVVGKFVIRKLSVPKYPLTAPIAARSETTRSMLLSVWKYLVAGLFMIALLSMLGATRWNSVALTGSIGLIVAFGAQTLFKDVLAGFSVLLEGQYGVGDRVKLFGPDIEGVVEAIGLRITVIREEDGSRVFVPNGGVVAVRAIPPGAVREASRRRPDQRGEGRGDGRSGGRGGRGGSGGTSGSGGSPRPPRTPRPDGAPAPLTSDPTEAPSSSEASTSESGQPGTGAPRRSRRGGRRRGGSRRPPVRQEGTDGTSESSVTSSGPSTPAGSGTSAPTEAPSTSTPSAPTPPQTPPAPSPSAPTPPAPTPPAPAPPAPPAPRQPRPEPSPPQTPSAPHSDRPDSDGDKESPWSIE